MKTPIEKFLDEIEYTPLPNADEPAKQSHGTPYATHEGVLKLGDIELKVYQLNTGQRVIDQADVLKMFGMDESQL